jgi:hypothetical protein
LPHEHEKLYALLLYYSIEKNSLVRIILYQKKPVLSRTGFIDFTNKLAKSRLLKNIEKYHETPMTKFSTHKRMIIGVASKNDRTKNNEMLNYPEASGQHDR